MAAVAIGSKAVGSVVKIKVDGTLRNFIVVHQGKPSSIYDASCNGTWLLMEDIYEKYKWHVSNMNDYQNSAIYTYLINTWINKLDANIRAQVKQIKIPYVNGTANSAVASGANGMSCKVFLLSGYEVGWTQNTHPRFPIDGAVLDYFKGLAAMDAKRIAYLNGSATDWWLRSPDTITAEYAWFVNSQGNLSSGCTNNFGVRPALILPSTLLVTDGGSVTANMPPTAPASITLPDTIWGGRSATVSWTPSSDAQNDLEGYILERSTDGGKSWTQVYQGSACATTNTVPFGTESIMYRVKAYDSDGLASGYTTSQEAAVINNMAPSAPASITVPLRVQGGGTLTVSWGESTDSDGNFSGYALERQVDGGAWEEVYKGPGLSYTDSITKGWQAVAYRVRAFDDQGAYSDHTTSDSREVNNNTPPEIHCAATGDQGVKDAGFSVSYTVTDEEGDPITVTESLDGAERRTFLYADGPESFPVDGVDFLKLSNGSHRLAISATDGKGVSTHELTFQKLVTAASVTLAAPMEADAEISVCVLSVNGELPEDASFRVEVTNNGLDAEPVWEDCTTAVRAGMNYVFTNRSAQNGSAFNLRLQVERGGSGAGGFLTSIQGGFQ